MNKFKYIFFIIIFLLISFLIIFFFKDNDSNIKDIGEIKVEENDNSESTINSVDIIDVDGKDTNYEFEYRKEIFRVYYTYDNWKIYDSYKIKNQADMKIICQALIDIHPIHGRDRISYRTADDMVYEWVQHNIAYEILPEDSKWRNNAKNVDFDPDDQGKSLKEMFDERTNNNEKRN